LRREYSAECNSHVPISYKSWSVNLAIKLAHVDLQLPTGGVLSTHLRRRRLAVCRSGKQMLRVAASAVSRGLRWWHNICHQFSKFISSCDARLVYIIKLDDDVMMMLVTYELNPTTTECRTS